MFMSYILCWVQFVRIKTQHIFTIYNPLYHPFSAKHFHALAYHCLNVIEQSPLSVHVHIVVIVVVVVVIVVIIIVIIIVIDVVVNINDNIKDNQKKVHKAEHRKLSLSP